ncbi:uncharacterized protein BX664DRAFT_322736, partial [Halteromyces radiatus]|uniref:uncharacterized protein n=1 Tax=Halteromyces radiatus TaxID=101107 RepID=UPI00221F3916
MLEILYNDLAKLTTDKELFTATILPKVQDLYDTFIQYFPKLPRPMATPDHIEGAMSSLVRSNSRCQEMLVSKNKELDIIQDCIRWEATWRLLFQMIKDCQFKLEDFVLRFARWRPPTDSTIHRINDLSLQQQSSAIRQQCEEKTNQLCDLHVQLDSLCNDVSTNNVSNIITKLLLAKFNQAEYHSRHVILLIHFMDLVMKQNEMVQALWCRITRVDNDLSSLLLKNRETSNDSSYDHDKEENDDISRVYSISNDQHAQLSKDVDQIRLDISDMIYPVRPLLQNGYHGDGSSDDDHDDSNNNNNNGVALDDIDNNTIRETLKNGLDQLDQRVLELGRLLLVNNKRSLRQASVQSFKQQLRSCLDLLNGLKSKLEIVISSLECPLPQVESDSDGSAFETRISTLETSLDSTHGVLETLEFNKNLLSELSRIHDQFFGDIWLVNESTSKTIDDDNDDDGNGDDQLEPTYKYILKEWDDIQSTSSRINSQIKDKDLPDMLQRGVEKLLDQLQELDNIPLIVHYSSISKDQFTLWMAKLEYARQMYTYLRPRINHEKVSILKSQLDDANNKIVRIDGSLSMMEKKIEQWQLFSKHEIKIKAFVDQVMKMEQQLKDLQQIFDTMDYTTSSGNNSDDALQDDDNYRRGKTQQRQITENIQSFKSVYMDLCNFFIQQQQIQIANNYHDDFLSSRMKSQQDQMESAWSNLQRTATATAQRISMMDRWRDIYINLQDSRRTLYGCKTTLEMIMLQKSNTSIDRPITDMTRTTTLIDTVKRQLASILPWLKDLPEQLDNDLLYNNDYHYGLFFGYHQETLNLASLVQQLLKDHYLATEGKHLFQIYQDTIDERWQDCIKQCTLLKQYEQNYQQYHGPQGDSNSIIISNLHAMLENHASVEDIKRRMMIYRDEVFSDTGDMKLLGDRLAIEFGYNDELKDLQHKLSSSLTALDNAILFDEKRYQFMMAVERYANQTTEILGTLTEFHHVISSLQEIGHSSEGDNDFAEVLERYRKLEETMLEQTSFDTQQHGDDGDDNELRVAWVTWLDQLHQEIGKKWNLCMDAMEIVQKQQHIDHQKKQLGTKLDGLLRYVNDMKDQVNALHLLEYQNITVEHQELDDIENEFHDTLCAKIDSLLDLTKEGDKAMIGDDIQQLRTSLRQAADDLRSIIQRKRQDAERQDRAMQMMNHLDKLEQVINHMEDDIARAAPHHARIINDAFVKSDLQDLRTELVKSYKACSQKMASLFDKIPHDTTLAATTNLLTEAKQRWTKTKEKAVARERELQTCIEQLQHDFFTKLAIVSKKQQQQKNTIRSSFIFPTTSSPSTSYQVDKENSLDIQVGRVLKDQPYRPKVKMVPGQVGKYWIGSVHPRLVYCRILKSKVVMVRVGGGWVELSQFLLDHGCNEGVVISDVPPLEKNARFNEAYIPFSSRSLSPSGRVVLRGGGGVLKYGNDSMGSLSPSRSSSKTSTNTRCRSPLTGYTDGERYVRVDEAGNHLALKMTRAEDDYFIPFYQM